MNAKGIVFFLALLIAFSVEIKTRIRKHKEAKFTQTKLTISKYLSSSNFAAISEYGASLTGITLTLDSCVRVLFSQVPYFFCYQSDGRVTAYKDSMTSTTYSIISDSCTTSTVSGSKLSVPSYTANMKVTTTTSTCLDLKPADSSYTKLVLFPTRLAWTKTTVTSESDVETIVTLDYTTPVITS